MIDVFREYWRNYLYTDGYQLTGLVITIWLLLFSVVAGSVLAVPMAVARSSGNRLLSRGVWLYTYLFRGTPLFVQLLLCYTGIFSLNIIRNHELTNAFFRDGMHCSLLVFVLNTCAYTTEIFAGAIKATPAGEIEAGLASGMSRFQLYLHVILPSALRRSLPSYSNEVILVFHSTSVAFAATVPDLLKVARDVNSATYQSFSAFGIAFLLYTAITFALVSLFRQAENRWLAYLKPQND